MNVLLLKSDDWMGLYVDNKIISQDHKFDLFFLLEQSEKLGFKSSDIRVLYVEKIDFNYLERMGCYPNDLNELKGNYSSDLQIYLGSKCRACGGISNHDTNYTESEENCVLCGQYTQWEHLYK